MSVRAWLAHPVSCDCIDCAYVWAHLDDDDDEGGDAAEGELNGTTRGTHEGRGQPSHKGGTLR